MCPRTGPGMNGGMKQYGLYGRRARSPLEGRVPESRGEGGEKEGEKKSRRMLLYQATK